MTRVAVLGCGSIGSRHLRNLQSMGFDDLIAFDPDPSTCKKVHNEIGIACVSDVSQVWKQTPNVTFITSPSNQHVGLAREAALLNSHIFVEKPLSYSQEGLDDLCEIVCERNLVAMVGCNMRFHPGPSCVKKLLDDNKIGTIISARIKTGSYLPRWRPWQDYRTSYSASIEWGGAILDCVHEIDLAHWFFGEAEVLSSHTIPARAIGLATDGLAEILLKHHSGLLCNVHLNFIQHNYRKTCEIIGMEGTIDWDFTTRQVVVFGSDGEKSETFYQPDGWEINQMYVDEIEHFFSAIAEHRVPMNTLKEARRSLEICLKVRQAGI